jgi:hypothetical protein
MSDVMIYIVSLIGKYGVGEVVVLIDDETQGDI